MLGPLWRHDGWVLEVDDGQLAASAGYGAAHRLLEAEQRLDKREPRRNG